MEALIIKFIVVSIFYAILPKPFFWLGLMLIVLSSLV
jgi:hypothetical protein